MGGTLHLAMIKVPAIGHVRALRPSFKDKNLFRKISGLTGSVTLLILVHVERLRSVFDHTGINRDFPDIFHGRQFKHGLQQSFFHDRTKPSCAGFSVHCFFCDRFESVVSYLEFYAFQFKQLTVLLDQCVFRLGKNRDQRWLVEFFQSGHYWHTANEFRDQSVLDEIFRFKVAEQLANAVFVRLALDVGTETDAGFL